MADSRPDTAKCCPDAMGKTIERRATGWVIYAGENRYGEGEYMKIVYCPWCGVKLGGAAQSFAERWLIPAIFAAALLMGFGSLLTIINIALEWLR